jgi:hypothetical protein
VMMRRKLIFGLAFLTAGILLMAASPHWHGRHAVVTDSEHDKVIAGHFASETSDCAEGAGVAGAISLVPNICFLTESAISAVRARGIS